MPPHVSNLFFGPFIKDVIIRGGRGGQKSQKIDDVFYEWPLTLTTTSSMHKLTKIVDIWVTRPGPHPAPPAYQRDFGMTHNDDFIFYRNYSQLKLQKFI